MDIYSSYSQDGEETINAFNTMESLRMAFASLSKELN